MGEKGTPEAEDPAAVSPQATPIAVPGGASASTKGNIDSEAEQGVPEVVGDVVPDGGYGWVVMACVLGSNAVTWGNNTTYGVYTAYYLQNNYFKASTLDYAWVGGLSVAMALGIAPGVNWMTQKFHYKVPIYLGATLVVIGQCLAGICTSFGPFLVCQGVVFGAGLGMVLVPSQPLLAHWFDPRLSLAQGLAASGSGLGGLILANTTRAILERPGLGVKWALIINGLISGLVLFPAITLLRGRHKAVGARAMPYESRWFVHPGFVWVLLWGFFAMIAYFIAIYSLASFATSALGLSQSQGAALQSILSAGQMIGRPAWGWALDKGGRINMTILCYLLCGLSTLAIWLPARSFSVLAFFAFVQGVTGGTIWAAAAPIAARVVGVKDLASAMAIFWIVLVPPAIAGQPMAIALLNHSTESLGRTGEEAYYISIGFCGGTAVFSAILLYGAKRHLQGSWKLWQRT